MFVEQFLVDVLFGTDAALQLHPAVDQLVPLQVGTVRERLEAYLTVEFVDTGECEEVIGYCIWK